MNNECCGTTVLSNDAWTHLSFSSLQIVRAKERIDSEMENIQESKVKEETKKGNDTWNLKCV